MESGLTDTSFTPVSLSLLLRTEKGSIVNSRSFNHEDGDVCGCRSVGGWPCQSCKSPIPLSLLLRQLHSAIPSSSKSHLVFLLSPSLSLNHRMRRRGSCFISCDSDLAFLSSYESAIPLASPQSPALLYRHEFINESSSLVASIALLFPILLLQLAPELFSVTRTRSLLLWLGQLRQDSRAP